jgi:uncharacterized membrane protein HdeD (DUF308 family)
VTSELPSSLPAAAPATAHGLTRSAPEPPAARSARLLRDLYVYRAGFSACWVAAIAALATLTTPGAATLAQILLVLYPVSDGVATLADICTSRGAPRRTQYVNLAIDIAGAAAILAAVESTLDPVITVFGYWAIATGAVMVVVTALRGKAPGGQWLMIISGAGSVVAGATFVGSAVTPAGGLDAVAQYSAGGHPRAATDECAGRRGERSA